MNSDTVSKLVFGYQFSKAGKDSKGNPDTQSEYWLRAEKFRNFHTINNLSGKLRVVRGKTEYIFDPDILCAYGLVELLGLKNPETILESLTRGFISGQHENGSSRIPAEYQLPWYASSQRELDVLLGAGFPKKHKVTIHPDGFSCELIQSVRDWYNKSKGLVGATYDKARERREVIEGDDFGGESIIGFFRVNWAIHLESDSSDKL
jgi:hypothetical protein